MKHFFFSSGSFLALLIVFLSIMCGGDMPTHYIKNSENVHAKISVLNPDSAIVQGKPVAIQMIVRYPDLIKSIKVTFDQSIPDTFIVNFAGSDEIYDTFYFTEIFTVAETKKVKALFELSDGSFKTFYCSFIVNQKNSGDTLYSKPIIQEISSVMTLPAGTADTLYFTLKTKESDIVNSIQLLNTGAFKAGEIKPVAAGIDTFSFIFTPSVIKDYTFSFETTVNHEKDTVFYNISVFKATSLFWKQDTVTINAVEGSALNIPIVLYLTDTSSANIKFRTDKGIITGKSLDYAVPYGSSESDSIIVTVKKDNDSSELKLYLRISSSDTLKPVITSLMQSDSAFITSVSSVTWKFKVRDQGAGIGIVEFILGTVVLTDTLHADSIYQCTVNNLVQGQKNTLKIRAFDKSMNKNMDSLIVYITFDSTLSDTLDPVITFINPSADSTRISSSSIDVKVSCTDNNSIKNVTCLLGAISMTVVKDTGNFYTAPVTGLVSGANTVTFYATDGSSNNNITSKSLTVIYNQVIEDSTAPVIALKTAMPNGGSIFSDSITVQIACIDDNGIAMVTCTRAGLPIEVKKISDSIYSSHITGLTASSADTITFVVTDSSVNANKNTFVVVLKYVPLKVIYSGNENTAGSVPIDTNFYKTAATVKVMGNTGILEKTGCSFTGWNTLADGTGTAYYDSNTFQIGTVNVTLYAQWKKNPVYLTITYNGNGNKSGTVPLDDSLYETGMKISIKGNSGNLHKSSYLFAGWNTLADGTGTEYSNGDTLQMGSANVTLYAQWKQNPVYFAITYNGNGNTSGTVPVDESLYKAGVGAVVKDNAGDLQKTGYWFNGWNTRSDGSGIHYYQAYTLIIGYENVTLFAQWTANP